MKHGCVAIWDHILGLWKNHELIEYPLTEYCRLLDPILLELLSPTIIRRPVVRSIMTKEINVLEYQRPFDQHRVIYLLDILLTVVHFGGHNFSRVAAVKHISHSFSPQFIEDMSRGKTDILICLKYCKYFLL